MINLIIDTNIYRKNPKLDNRDFQALEKLSNAGALKVHVPYVVQREFQTQQRDLCKKELDKSISGLNSLLRRPLSKEKLEELDAIKKTVEAGYHSILEASESYFTDWLSAIGGSILPLCESQAFNAMEAYFSGDLPLTQAKTREDIPDSFIVQSIVKLAKSNDKIIVIAEDQKVRNSFDKNDRVESYPQLGDFIKSATVQDKLKDIDLIEDLPAIFVAIASFENEHAELQSGISSAIGDYIVGSLLTDATIPDDNNEASISSFGNVGSIELELDNLVYYGSGNVGVPFELEMDVYAFYYIFKADYYGMENPPSVSDHNDHYFEAEDEFNVIVRGIASVTFDRDFLDFNDFSNSVDLNTLKINTVDSIELC